jgi:hypothetical protein
MMRYGSECRIRPRHEYDLKQLRLLSNNYKSDSRELKAQNFPKCHRRLTLYKSPSFWNRTRKNLSEMNYAKAGGEALRPPAVNRAAKPHRTILDE